MIATIIFTLFTFIQLYSWFFTTSYNQSSYLKFLQHGDSETYKIQTQFFLPTVAFIDLESMQLNNQTKYDTGYRIVKRSTGSSENFGLVLCSTYIERLGLPDAEKQALKTELIYPEHLYCPDLTEFWLQGQGIQGENYMYFYAQAKPGYIESGDVGLTMIYQATITRYFDPDYYKDNGFLGFITLDNEFIFP